MNLSDYKKLAKKRKPSAPTKYIGPPIGYIFEFSNQTRGFQTTLPFPVSVNSMFGGGSGQRRFKSSGYKKWLSSCPKLPDLKLDKISITYRFYFPDNRVRDAQNYIKGVTDYMVNCGLIKDDCWQCVTGGETLIPMGIDKEKPRVEIELFQV